MVQNEVLMVVSHQMVVNDVYDVFVLLEVNDDKIQIDQEMYMQMMVYHIVVVRDVRDNYGDVDIGDQLMLIVEMVINFHYQ